MLKEFSLELTGTSVMGALAENGTSETDEGYLFWRSEDILKLQSWNCRIFLLGWRERVQMSAHGL